MKPQPDVIDHLGFRRLITLQLGVRSRYHDCPDRAILAVSNAQVGLTYFDVQFVPHRIIKAREPKNIRLRKLPRASIRRRNVPRGQPGWVTFKQVDGPQTLTGDS